jgi:hypothetical protein
MRRAGVLVGLLSVAAIAGCGGSGGGQKNGSASTPATTKAEFIARTDALCAAGKAAEPTEAQVVALLSEVPLPAAHVAAVLHGASAEVAKIDAEIAALPRPAGDTAAIGTWLAQASHLGALIGQLGDKVAVDDQAAMGNIETSLLEDVGAPENFAATYGLTSCDTF